MFEKLTTKFNKASSRSKQLKEEVATLQKELAELASTQSEMDKIRADENAVYEKNKPEMEQGLKGVKLALKIPKGLSWQIKKNEAQMDNKLEKLIAEHEEEKATTFAVRNTDADTV